MHNNDPVTNVVDGTAITIGVASFFQYLPSIAAALSIVWLLIRIAESPTVQKLFGKYAWLKETNNDTRDDD